MDFTRDFWCIESLAALAPLNQQGFAIMLIRKIEVFLRHTKMPPTRFGRLAARDPRFVLDLRMGRMPRPETEARVEHFMNEYRETANVL